MQLTDAARRVDALVATHDAALFRLNSPDRCSRSTAATLESLQTRNAL